MGALSATPTPAQNVFLSASVGGFSGSDNNIQKVYGLMPVFKGGIGIESDGWGTELDLIGATQKGTPINLYNTAGLSMSSQLTDLEFAARFSKALGRKGEDIRPYLGIQVSYDSLTETLSATYNGQSASVSGSASGFGFGVFSGVDFPLSKNLLLYLEGIYNYTQVSAQVTSSSGGTAIARKSVDSGGVSASIGVKYFF